MKRSATKGATRLDREQWLSRALEYLAKEGREKLTIDNLVAALGVTKGSFYWHFENRKDFLEQLLQYWDEKFTQSVIASVMELEGDPKAQLWRIIEVVHERNLTRYDIVVRAWATQEPDIAEYVRRVDQTRTRVVRGLFSQLGFDGVALEMRTRSFVTFVSLDAGILVKQSKKQRLSYLREFHELITARS